MKPGARRTQAKFSPVNVDHLSGVSAGVRASLKIAINAVALAHGYFEDFASAKKGPLARIESNHDAQCSAARKWEDEEADRAEGTPGHRERNVPDYLSSCECRMGKARGHRDMLKASLSRLEEMTGLKANMTEKRT